MNTSSKTARVRRLSAQTSALARGLWCMFRQLLLVIGESAAVFFFMATLRAGALAKDHPWVTGKQKGKKGEEEDEPIWRKNIVYRSPSRRGATEESDAATVEKVGHLLRKMVERSLPAQPEIPHGPKRRMPHAVNYIHGSVHHNGVFMVFDDIPDLMAHVTDRAFRRDLIRFAREQKREVTFVLRKRKVDPELYAYCVGCLRSQLPWFSNPNGPTKKPVLWGNPAPYPVINLINGAWMSDLFALWRGCGDELARPPVDDRTWFADAYGKNGRREVRWADRLLAWLMFIDVRLRGFKGQLFFTRRKRIEPHRLEEYRKSGGYWSWFGCHHVPHPFRSYEQNEEEAA